jgi:hypothetical protein
MHDVNLSVDERTHLRYANFSAAEDAAAAAAAAAAAERICENVTLVFVYLHRMSVIFPKPVLELSRRCNNCAVA